ncbi:hypothetical protein BH24ACI2_BH24ACI2_04570 [soil metagenome]|jgi:hypothetical protein
MCVLWKKILLGLMISFSLLGCKSSLKEKDLLSTEEKQNADFSVKITSFRERRAFAQSLAGAYYIFEVKTKKEQDWREIMSVEYDDPVPIDKNSISFVNEKVGFVFLIKKYAFTTDGGVTWKVWDLSKSSSVEIDPSCRIRNVKIKEKGKGLMNLKCNNTNKVLITNDYGISWKNEE